MLRIQPSTKSFHVWQGAYQSWHAEHVCLSQLDKTYKFYHLAHSGIHRYSQHRKLDLATQIVTSYGEYLQNLDPSFLAYQEWQLCGLSTNDLKWHFTRLASFGEKYPPHSNKGRCSNLTVVQVAIIKLEMFKLKVQAIRHSPSCPFWTQGAVNLTSLTRLCNVFFSPQ